MDELARDDFLLGLDLETLDLDILNSRNFTSPELLEYANFIAGISGPYNGSDSSLFAFAGDGGNGTYNGHHLALPRLSESDRRLQQVIHNLNLYVVPIIVIIGVMGNTISFFVYTCTPALSRQSSSLYLAFLAAVNNGYLATLFFFWIDMVGVHVRHQPVWCQASMYAQYVFSFLSAWTVVSFTCERWIVVFHPLKRHELCTRRRALLVIGALSLGALGVYSFSVFTTSVHEAGAGGGLSMCLPKPEYYSFLKVCDLVDTVNAFILPMLAIVSMNAGIGVRICRYTSRKKDAAQAHKPGVARGSGGHAEMSNISVLNTAGGGGGGADGESLEFSTRGTANGTRTSVMYLGMAPTSARPPRPWRFLTRRHHTQLRITRALLIVSR